MKLKKVGAFLLASVMMISAMGCGAKEAPQKEGADKTEESTTSKKDTSPDKATASDVELKISIWDTNQEPGLKEIMDDFTEKTGIKTSISVIKWDEYWTMLEAGAQGGSLPDVFWMHSNESERYMSNDMLLDITEKIKESDVIDPGNYPEDIWSLYTLDGKYYAMPKDIDTIALWYNKAYFDEAGLEYPTTDWTWEDMFEAAKKLTTQDHFGLAIRNDNNQAGYYNMIFGNGGYILSEDKKKSGYDDPKTIEALKLLEEAIKAGVMPPLESMAENGEDGLFTNGKVAMVLQGSWMLAAYRDNEYTAENADVIELPKNSQTGRRVSLYNGLGWAAAANGQHTEEAWQLLEYLGSKEAQLKQAQLGVTMSAYKGTSNDWVNAGKFNLQAYINMMEDMEIRPFTKSTVIWENEANDTLKKVYLGEMSMEDACKQIAEKMNEVLAEE